MDGFGYGVPSAPTMGFADAIRVVLNKYADFNGRARRSEYWWWALAFAMCYVVVAIFYAIAAPLGIVLFVLLVLATFLPGLAVLVRRLHDTNRSGAWFFIDFIPFVGPIILLVFLASDGSPVPNHYGPSPKYASR